MSKKKLSSQAIILSALISIVGVMGIAVYVYRHANTPPNPAFVVDHPGLKIQEVKVNGQWAANIHSKNQFEVISDSLRPSAPVKLTVTTKDGGEFEIAFEEMGQRTRYLELTDEMLQFGSRGKLMLTFDPEKVSIDHVRIEDSTCVVSESPFERSMPPGDYEVEIKYETVTGSSGILRRTAIRDIEFAAGKTLELTLDEFLKIDD